MKLNKLVRVTVGLFLASIFVFASCNNKVKKSSTFELKGDLSQAGEGIKVYLDRLMPNNSVEHLDSTAIDKNGDFTFNTPGIYKGFYTLRITKGDFAVLILDSAEKVELTGNAQNLGYTYDVSGSPDSKLFWDYNMRSKIYFMQIDSMQKRFQSLVNAMGRDTVKIAALNDAFQKPYDSILDLQKNYVKNFIKSNAGSFASIPVVQQLHDDFGEDNNGDYAFYVDSILKKNYPNSLYVKHFDDKVQVMRKLPVDSSAPEISLPDTSGKSASLSSLKGKYVLIDFWASWCKPCKESIPYLCKIYDKYKDKNFTIFSVSLDDNKSSWKDAIEYFKLDWTQVSELKKGKTKAESLYYFDGIPYMVLVSPDGKIVDKGFSDTELDKELEGILK
jgi:thiol-disulfide isomerase/thioredoxin